MSQTVFICSTCYDLIDLRAELDQELRGMALQPLLSDQPTSEFTVIPDASSIESCLVNVRKSDIFIIILSQRYGPSLAKAGYPDVSATHLEYLEACKANKPIYMYVRDRLEADYMVWKKNKGNPVVLTWVPEKDYKIFNLLEDHRKLALSKKSSNWFWVFRNSVELKQRIRKDLAADSGKAILSDLMERGRIAYLLPEVQEWSVDRVSRYLQMKLRVVNAGTAPALEPSLELNTDTSELGEVKPIRSLLPGELTETEFTTRLTVAQVRKKNPVFWLECAYTTPEGHYIGDFCYMEFYWEPRQTKFSQPLLMYSGKKYYHSKGVVLMSGEESNIP